MENIQSLRGMKDILKDESVLFRYFIKHCSRIAQNFGFEYLNTPILEETSLFKRSVGQSSDIVGKEMYQFIDKGNNDVCLRPEGTAGVVRMFVQNKLDRINNTNRYFYHGAMFRYERPQKGRLRQFHQFGCESFGEDTVYEDANIIIMLTQIFDFFKIEYKLLLNSLGCDQCMPKYKIELVNSIKKLDLCDDCKRRIDTNPIRILDCKNKSCQDKLYDVPKITNSLCQNCDDDFVALKSILDRNNIAYEIDTNLVRGLDYYTKTAFEFVSCDIGAQSAIAGGGRYDKLVEYLGGRKTPAIGFAIGIQRLMELIKIDEKPQECYYFGSMCDSGIDMVFSLANKKRKTTKAIVQYGTKSFTKHLNNATKQNANIVCLVDDENVRNNTIWIKNLQTKEEKIISIDEL